MHLQNSQQSWTSILGDAFTVIIEILTPNNENMKRKSTRSLDKVDSCSQITARNNDVNIWERTFPHVLLVTDVVYALLQLPQFSVAHKSKKITKEFASRKNWK